MEENRGTPAMKRWWPTWKTGERKKRKKEGIYVLEDRYDDAKNKLLFNINNKLIQIEKIG